MFRTIRSLGLLISLLATAGCAAPYPGLVKPVPRIGVLSPELENLSEAKLRATKGVRPVFPTALAVARVAAAHAEADYANIAATEADLEVVPGREADGWRKLLEVRSAAGGAVVTQVHFITRPVGGPASLKTLRNAAAALHAPLLLVYMEVDRSAQGQNSNAPAYWTGLGLLFVPGETIGQYTVCQAVLVDTQTGTIVGTLSSESRREENVTPGKVSSGRRRVADLTQSDAVTRLQNQAAESLKSLASLPARPQAAEGTPAQAPRPASARPQQGDARKPALQPNRTTAP